jgi:hypothetical protein
VGLQIVDIRAFEAWDNFFSPQPFTFLVRIGRNRQSLTTSALVDTSAYRVAFIDPKFAEELVKKIEIV